MLRVSFIVCVLLLAVGVALASNTLASPQEQELAGVLVRAQALLAAAHAGTADTVLTPFLVGQPLVSDADDSLRVAAEACWLEARISDQLPFDSTFRARSRAVLTWRERHTPGDRIGRVASMKSAAKLIAIADSAMVGEAILRDALSLARQEPRLPAAVEVGALHYYGQLAIGRGDYAAAVSRLREGYALAQAALGDSVGATYRVATDLALALQNNGDLVEARSVYEALIESSRHAPPGSSPLGGQLQSQLGLASVLRDLNDFFGARRVYEGMIRQMGNNLAPDDPFVLLAQHRYAMTLRILGVYDSALVIAKHVAERRLALNGPEYIEYAASVGLEGSLLCDLNRFDEAEPLLRESYRIYRDHRGADDPNALSRLNNLGNLARARGDNGAAESLFTILVAGRRARLGPNHALVAEGLYNLALAQDWQGQDAQAISSGLEAADIRRRMWSAIIPFLEERAALQLVDEYWVGHDIAVDVLTREAKQDSGAISRTWDRVTAMRSLVLDEVARRRNEVSSRDSVRDHLAWDAWTGARAELSRLALAGIDTRKDPRAPVRRDFLQRAADSLERVLASQNAAVRAHRRERELNDSAIRARLPDDAVLVGFVRFPRMKRADPLDRWRKDLTDHYSAFVRLGTTGAMHVVDIGEASVLDSLVLQWSTSLAATDPRAPRSMARYIRDGAALRRVVWDPLRPYLGGAKRVYLVPDGVLQRVVWETLPVASGRFLIDEDRILVRLFSERDLTALGTPDEDGGLLACGGIDFDGPARTLATSTKPARVRGPRPSCLALGALRFAALPGTREEVEVAQRRWQEHRTSRAEVLIGTAPSRDRFTDEAPGRSFLHLATHGYFVEDSCLDSGAGRESFKHDPLMRCGFVMAGANRHPGALAGVDDGLLTAAEIAQLDLSHCEVALLSACGSAQGDLGRIEGIFGLQRAFRVAGARSIVMSQWAVDDNAARAWVDAFYRARLTRDGRTAEASRAASKAVLAQLRSAHLSAAPRWWATFVAAGDPR